MRGWTDIGFGYLNLPVAGQGEDADLAKQSAARDALDYLKLMTKK